MNLLEKAADRLARNRVVKDLLTSVGAKKAFIAVNRRIYDFKFDDSQELGYQGSRLVFDTSSPLAKGVFARNIGENGLESYEDGWADLLYSRMDCGDVVLDIGSQIGIFTLVAALKAEEVYTFDLDPRNAEMLRKNVDANSFDNVLVEQKAVGSEDGETRFELSSYGTVSRIDPEGSEAVDMVTLDSYCKDRDIDPQIIKLDVEGAGYDVLNGAEKVIEESRPKIFFEFHPQQIRAISGVEPVEALEFLQDRGYSLMEFREGSLKELEETPDHIVQILCLPE